MFFGRGCPGRASSSTLRLTGLWIRPAAHQLTNWAVGAVARAEPVPSRAGRDRADEDVAPFPRRVYPPSRGTDDALGQRGTPYRPFPRGVDEV